MAGCSTYFTWMLPLLLLLSISLHQSSSKNKCSLRSLQTDVEILGRNVKDCPDNCSSADITDQKCKCLNLNVSQEKCAFPDYFIKGLKFLHPNISNQDPIQALIKNLVSVRRRCKINFCSLHVTYEPVLSPLSLYLKLEELTQQIKANLSSLTSVTNAKV